MTRLSGWPIMGLLFTLWPAVAQAEDSWLIDRIDVSGLERTSREVIERELLYRPGHKVTPAALEESLQRLRNTQLFATVDHRLETRETANGTVRASKIAVDERWTTIPIFKYNRGGGVDQIVLGAYDINLLGRYLEGGAQVERLGEATSGVLWFRHPRLFGDRLQLSLDVWDTRRPRSVYANQGRRHELQQAFTHQRRKVRLGLAREWRWWLTTAAVIEGRADSFSDDALSEEQLSQRQDESMPQGYRGIEAGFDFTLGRLNSVSSIAQRGWEWQHKLRHYAPSGTETAAALEAGAADDPDAAYNSYESKARMFGNWGRLSLGCRLGFGTTSATSAADKFYMGGLDKLRGFRDGRFHGDRYWLANSEARFASYRSPWLVVQNVAFYDAAGVTATEEDPTGLSGEALGIGLRIISPKIYRLVGRLDFARARRGDGRAPLNIGVQQFF